MVGGLAALLAAGIGCRSDFSTPDDALRRRVLEQDQQIATLQTDLTLRKRQIAGLQAELAVYAAGDHPTTALPEGVEVPRFAGLEADSYSGLADDDGDGLPEVVRLFVDPVDQLGRMLPVAGTLTARVVRLGEQEPGTVVAEQRYEPPAWDGQYRDGFTGPYYVVEVPLPDEVRPSLAGRRNGELVVRVELEQVGTGVSWGLTKPL